MPTSWYSALLPLLNFPLNILQHHQHTSETLLVIYASLLGLAIFFPETLILPINLEVLPCPSEASRNCQVRNASPALKDCSAVSSSSSHPEAARDCCELRVFVKALLRVHGWSFNLLVLVLGLFSMNIKWEIIKTKFLGLWVSIFCICSSSVLLGLWLLFCFVFCSFWEGKHFAVQLCLSCCTCKGRGPF